MARGERGITILGFLFVAVVVVAVALIGFRVLPAYVEYVSVQKALQAAIDETPSGNVGDIRRSFDRKIGAGYVDSVRPSDVQVSRQNNVITASVSWQRILPLIANVSILLDFDAEASR
jgi:hypothetical protein